MKKVIVGMSGGVDSSVAALLLQQQGYDVAGMFMKNWEDDDTEQYCNAAADLKDAQLVCDKLDIPLHTVNFAQEYWENVFQVFLRELQLGRTPNPDILCNREIKFNYFLKYAKHLGANYIATGHYAKTDKLNNNTLLFKASDLNKDQSYFLYAVPPAALAQTIFPLADLTKPQVRAIAQQYQLDNHAKKDSTGICFIGKRNFNDFIKKYINTKPGNIISDCGTVLGTHNGAAFYTIGQRQGLMIGGNPKFNNDPWFVVAKDIANNEVIVAQGANNPLLFKKQLIASECNVHVGNVKYPLKCSAKTRYRQQDSTCTIYPMNDSQFKVEFEQPERAVTTGQSIVFYQDNICLGGGIIDSCG